MTRKLKISLGSDSFERLITTSDIFVDKSLFIQEVLESGEDAILITRPRRWGKSLALDMLKTFLSMEVDAYGNKKEENSNRLLFEGGKIDLDFGESKQLLPLKIATEASQYLARQGQYPVISISFKDVKATSYEEVKRKLEFITQNLYEQYDYILKSKNISEIQKNKFNYYVNGKFDDVSLTDSIRFLSELLDKHYGRKAYILVDECDKPVNFFLESSLNDNVEERANVVELIEEMISTCGKGNIHLEKIVLTGIFDTFVKEGNSGFNNLSIYGITHKEFSRYFGFSSDEVKDLIEKLQFQDASKISNNIKDWYNGYSVPLYGNKYVHAYTPWAVMRYLKSAYNDETTAPQNYWVQSGASTIFQALLKNEGCTGSTLTSSLLNITKTGSTTLSYNKAVSLFKYDLNNASENEKIFSYLLINSGYLTALNMNNTHVTLSIPNYEVREELKDVFDTHVKNVDNKKGDICTEIQKEFHKKNSKSSYLDFVQAVINQDLEEIESHLQELKCDNSRHAINPLHLAALSANSDIFQLVAFKCGIKAFEKSSYLTITDYAYMSPNSVLYNSVQKYNPDLSIYNPRITDGFECVIANNLFTTIGAGIAFTFSAIIAPIVVDNIQDIFQGITFLENHPFLTAVTTIPTAITFGYFGLSDYKNTCSNYEEFTNIKDPPFYTLSLKEFLKYRLLHNDTSYVKLGTECNDKDSKISQFDSDISTSDNLAINYSTPLSITLCSKDDLNAIENNSNPLTKALVCTAQIATLGVIGKFAYNLYQISGTVLRANGVPASLNGPLVAENNIAKTNEMMKLLVGGTIEALELYLDPLACPDTLNYAYEYISTKLIGDEIANPDL